MTDPYERHDSVSAERYVSNGGVTLKRPTKRDAASSKSLLKVRRDISVT